MLKKISLYLIFFSITIIFSGCTTYRSVERDGPPSQPVDVSKIPNPVPHPLKLSKFGNPPSYTIHGIRYHVLNSAKGYHQRGIASWYGTKFHGQSTSSGEPYNMFAMTAANRTLPIPIYARVTNLENGRSIIVKVNDRGPFASNRIMDLSYVAAKKLGYAEKGTALVDVQAITFDTPIDRNHPIRYAMQQPKTNAHYTIHYVRQAQINSNPSIHDAMKQPRIYLQVGAFYNHVYAKKLQWRLQKLTKQPILIKAVNNQKQSIYKVQIGPLAGKKESDRLHDKLLKQFGLHSSVNVIS